MKQPTINGHCTNFVLFDETLQLPLKSKMVTSPGLIPSELSGEIRYLQAQLS